MTASESVRSTVDSILNESTEMVQLFVIVTELEEYLTSEVSNVSNYVSIKSYDFKELILEYGPGHKQTVKEIEVVTTFYNCLSFVTIKTSTTDGWFFWQHLDLGSV